MRISLSKPGKYVIKNQYIPEAAQNIHVCTGNNNNRVMFLSTCISSTIIGLNDFKPQFYCSDTVYVTRKTY